MANPNGQQRAKPFRDALRKKIAEAGGDPKRLERIADKLLSLAESGDVQAIKELADRLDGKVPQAIAGIDEDENLAPLVPILNLIGRPGPASAS